METSNPGISEPAYHSGMRQLQDRCDTESLRTGSTKSSRARPSLPRIGRSSKAAHSSFWRPPMPPDTGLFLQGGAPGFVRVTDDVELAFPSYDGNGMFRSLGNVLVNPAVGLLFIDFERPNRLRVNGSALVTEDDPLLAGLSRGAVRGSRARGAHLSELPALHPSHAGRRDLTVCAPR
jgi:hypothetical protein